ncbi:hypothetical protein Hanom_Chr13g01213171 [Helianthus anomalus]
MWCLNRASFVCTHHETCVGRMVFDVAFHLSQILPNRHNTFILKFAWNIY